MPLDEQHHRIERERGMTRGWWHAGLRLLRRDDRCCWWCGEQDMVAYIVVIKTCPTVSYCYIDHSNYDERTVGKTCFIYIYKGPEYWSTWNVIFLFSLFQVWFKNRRAKCRQQNNSNSQNTNTNTNATSTANSSNTTTITPSTISNTVAPSTTDSTKAAAPRPKKVAKLSNSPVSANANTAAVPLQIKSEPRTQSPAAYKPPTTSPASAHTPPTPTPSHPYSGFQGPAHTLSTNTTDLNGGYTTLWPSGIRSDLSSPNCMQTSGHYPTMPPHAKTPPSWSHQGGYTPTYYGNIEYLPQQSPGHFNSAQMANFQQQMVASQHSMNSQMAAAQQYRVAPPLPPNKNDCMDYNGTNNNTENSFHNLWVAFMNSSRCI